MGEGAVLREEGESLLRLPPVTVVQLPPSRPPRDRANMLYIILVIHGIGTLMPWNMFINAKDYFTDYKLVSSGNDTATEKTLNEFSTNIMGYLTLASQLPNLLCSFLNLFLQFGDASLTPRIVGSLLVSVSMFVATVILAMVDSTSWPVTFFYLTMTTVVVLNMACGIYQNSIYGVAAKLPQKYSNAVVLGSNLSGTLTAVLNIVSIAMSPNQRTAAIYYFVSALFILLVCLDTYFALPLLRCYRYYERPATSSSAPRRKMPPFWFIFRKAWPQCLNVFLVFFVTLALFPGVASDIKRYNKTFPLSDVYFRAVNCFLAFNLFALVGNFVPIWFRWPGPRFLWVPVVARLLFLPLFIACNYAPDKRVIPVYITSDWAYVLIMVLFAFSSGYLSSLSMMYAPGTVPSDLAPVAGMMAAFFLILGIFVGGNTVFLTTWLFTRN